MESDTNLVTVALNSLGKPKISIKLCITWIYILDGDVI